MSQDGRPEDWQIGIMIMLDCLSVGWPQWVWTKVPKRGWRHEVFTLLNDFRFDFRERDWELPDREYWQDIADWNEAEGRI